MGLPLLVFPYPKDRTSKLSPRAVPAVHLGLDEKRNGYLVYVPSLNRITTAHTVQFQEHRFLVFDDDGIASMPRLVKPLKDTEYKYREERDDEKEMKRLRKLKEADAQPEYVSSEEVRSEPTHDKSDSEDDPPSDSSETRRKRDSRPTRVEQDEKGPNPIRIKRPIERYGFEKPESSASGSRIFTSPRKSRKERVNRVADLGMYHVLSDDVDPSILSVDVDSTLSDIKVPKSFEEASGSRFFHRWMEAMKLEFTSLMELGTWKYVDRPTHRKVTKSRWVFALKLNRDGSIERFKARFVVCGYSQIKGEDYTHAFSATLRATSFRMLMAIAAGEKLKLEHFDVKNAFTQSDIDAEIYTEPPKGFPVPKGKDGKPQVLKLIKSLYGTKQASRLWQLKLRDHLVNKMGFKNSIADPCMYVKRDDHGGVMIIGVYVDDIILAHKNVKLSEFIDVFCGKEGFVSKHLGSLNWFLGMGVTQHP